MSGGKLAMLLLAMSLLAATGAAAQHRVTGVAANDVLNIRAAPDADATIVARIPPNGRGIRVIGGGNRFWVKVAYGGKTGFVNRRFIRPDAAAAATARRAVKTAAADPANDPLDEAYAGPPPSVTVEPSALPPPAPVSAQPKTSALRPPGAPKKDARAPAMTLENGSPQAVTTVPSPSTTELPETTVLAAPSDAVAAAVEAHEAPKTLLAPPSDMMTAALPSALECKGEAPAWSLTIANGVSTFQSDAERDVLEFGELKQSAASSKVWMAGGRNFASQLSLHLHETGTCTSAPLAGSAPYVISLRLNDGRVLTGCCRGSN
jgi:uncharacterized membrane protein